MPTLCRLVVLVVALALALPAGAWGQVTTTIPSNGGGDLSDEPPVDLDDRAGGRNGGGSSDGRPSDDGGRADSSNGSGAVRAEELPDTGSDPRLLLLAGAALLLLGLGLRLRTADADLY